MQDTISYIVHNFLLTRWGEQEEYSIFILLKLNPCPIKLFFVTQFTEGKGGYQPPCELENETPRYK